MESTVADWHWRCHTVQGAANSSIGADSGVLFGVNCVCVRERVSCVCVCRVCRVGQALIGYMYVTQVPSQSLSRQAIQAWLENGLCHSDTEPLVLRSHWSKQTRAGAHADLLEWARCSKTKFVAARQHSLSLTHSVIGDRRAIGIMTTTSEVDVRIEHGVRAPLDRVRAQDLIDVKNFPHPLELFRSSNQHGGNLLDIVSLAIHNAFPEPTHMVERVMIITSPLRKDRKSRWIQVHFDSQLNVTVICT